MGSRSREGREVVRTELRIQYARPMRESVEKFLS